MGNENSLESNVNDFDDTTTNQVLPSSLDDVAEVDENQAAEIAFEEWRRAEEERDEKKRLEREKKVLFKWNPFRSSRTKETPSLSGISSVSERGGLRSNASGTQDDDKPISSKMSDTGSVSSRQSSLSRYSKASTNKSVITTSSQGSKMTLISSSSINQNVIKLDANMLRTAARVERLLGLEGIEVGVHLPNKTAKVKRRKGLLRALRDEPNRLECEVVQVDKKRVLSFLLQDIIMLNQGTSPCITKSPEIDETSSMHINLQGLPDLTMEFDTTPARDVLYVALAVMCSRRLNKKMESLVSIEMPLVLTDGSESNFSGNQASDSQRG